MQSRHAAAERKPAGPNEFPSLEWLRPAGKQRRPKLYRDAIPQEDPVCTAT
jgi:hypothetical protein